MQDRKLVEDLAIAVRNSVVEYIACNEDYMEVLKKRPKDITRKIDMVAEDALDSELVKKGICARIISEEVGERIVPACKDPECTIVYDPVDGSNNLTAGIPYFCTAIALTRKTDGATFGDMRAGAVASVASGMFSAANGEGAFMDSKPLKTLKKTGKPIYAIYAYGSGKIPDRIIDIQENDCVVRTMGSMALDICMVARGAFYAVIDTRNKVSIYDLMAASIVLQETGGVITDIKGKPLDEIPVTCSGISILCAVDREMHSKLLTRLGTLP